MKTNSYLYWITFIAIQGGLIFGLNMAGISGAVSLIREYFVLDDVTLGAAVSSIMIGCLLGAIVVGPISDKWGRRPMLVVAALVFIISAIGCALSESISVLILFRITSGLGVGAVSVVGPTYVAEIAPAKKRGTLVSLNQFALVVGILLAYVFDYAFLDLNESWRFMLAVPSFFGLLFLVLLFISFPESPRWLVKAGKQDKAQKALLKIGGEDFAEQELANISKDLVGQGNTEVKLAEIFKRKYLWVIFLGGMLAFFAQVTGINAVLNYAPTIFSQSGLTGDQALVQSILLGLVNILATMFALWLIDRKGRKVLLTWGTGGMTITLGLIAYSFMGGGLGDLGVLVSILAYTAFYAASLAPVMWVVTSEIYSNRIRGQAMSFTASLVWLFSFITVQFFPLMLNKLGGVFAFGIFGFFSLLAFVFIVRFIPETKGKSLEQIQRDMGLTK